MGTYSGAEEATLSDSRQAEGRGQVSGNVVVAAVVNVGLVMG